MYYFSTYYVFVVNVSERYVYVSSKGEDTQPDMLFN